MGNLIIHCSFRSCRSNKTYTNTSTPADWSTHTHIVHFVVNAFSHIIFSSINSTYSNWNHTKNLLFWLVVITYCLNTVQYKRMMSSKMYQPHVIYIKSEQNINLKYVYKIAPLTQNKLTLRYANAAQTFFFLDRREFHGNDKIMDVLECFRAYLFISECFQSLCECCAD